MYSHNMFDSLRRENSVKKELGVTSGDVGVFVFSWSFFFFLTPLSGRDCWQEVKNRRKMVIMYRTYKAGKAGARHYIVEGGVSEAVFWLFFVKLSKKAA